MRENAVRKCNNEPELHLRLANLKFASRVICSVLLPGAEEQGKNASSCNGLDSKRFIAHV